MPHISVEHGYAYDAGAIVNHLLITKNRQVSRQKIIKNNTFKECVPTDITLAFSGAVAMSMSGQSSRCMSAVGPIVTLAYRFLGRLHHKYNYN